jgi:two-component sensor histidine kinase
MKPIGLGRAGSPLSYAAAIAMTAFAMLIEWGLRQIAPGVVPFAAFFPVILFSTLIGGIGAGVLSACIGGAVSWWAFLPPEMSFHLQSAAEQISLALYFLAALFLIWGGEHYRRLTKKLTDEEGLRQLAVAELAHRLKNKIATIQSIIFIRLREYPEVQHELGACLASLAATDELILGSQGRGADLRAILSAEILPYDESRVSLNGPEVFLPPKLALTMALLLHELATNAAKYGSFSTPAGRVSVEWSVASGNKLRVAWRESDGPAVQAPTRSGFGSRLFRHALEPFGGSVKADFSISGLVCVFTVTVPDV